MESALGELHNVPLHVLDHIDEHQSIETTVHEIVEKVSQLRASDLFFALDDNALLLGCRQMGILRRFRPFSANFGRKLINHIKALAGIDLGDRNRPSEGRWIFRREDASVIDLRINSIPTINGEDLTIRLLDRNFGLIPLDDFGLLSHELSRLKWLLGRKAGMILVTGPTGSGKSTTLYSCLQQLNDGSRKINTLEDPVEYIVKGIRQSQINPKLGIDFADLLVACLRQGPDVIMVGEIRDPQTAETAVRAAASGHLVLATLHSPFAAKAVNAMVSYGVAPRAFAETLLGVVSQRLVRRLCEHCRVPVDMSPVPDFLNDVRRDLPDDWTPCIYSAGHCERCHDTGFVASHCVPEILVATPEVRRAIADRLMPDVIARVARSSDAHLSFRRAALARVALGITTIEEVMRALPLDELEDPGDEATALPAEEVASLVNATSSTVPPPHHQSLRNTSLSEALVDEQSMRVSPARNDSTDWERTGGNG